MKSRVSADLPVDCDAPEVAGNLKGVFDAPVMNQSGLVQWNTPDDVNFIPSGKSYKTLIPGFYEPRCAPDRGFYLEKINCNVEGLLEFPETNSKKVVAEIQNFWTKESLYRDYDLAFRRGLLLYGPAGSGKSSTIKLVLKDVFERGGIAINFGDPVYLECIRNFRRIQPNTPLVVLLEDIDSTLERYGETQILNILDGVESIDKVVYLATTNYPEQLGDRIINRPSRFDRRFKMPHPGKESRKIYFNHLIKMSKQDIRLDVDLWSKDTRGMSVAHLKELFVAVCILGDKYDDVLALLKSMTEEKVSSKEVSNIGFSAYREGDDECNE